MESLDLFIHSTHNVFGDLTWAFLKVHTPWLKAKHIFVTALDRFYRLHSSQATINEMFDCKTINKKKISNKNVLQGVCVPVSYKSFCPLVSVTRDWATFIHLNAQVRTNFQDMFSGSSPHHAR